MTGSAGTLGGVGESGTADARVSRETVTSPPRPGAAGPDRGRARWSGRAPAPAPASVRVSVAVLDPVVPLGLVVAPDPTAVPDPVGALVREAVPEPAVGPEPRAGPDPLAGLEPGWLAGADVTTGNSPGACLLSAGPAAGTAGIAGGTTAGFADLDGADAA